MGDTYRTFRVAAVQASSVFCDRDATTDKACEMILRAGREGCELVALPEAFIPTYPYWAIISNVLTGIRLYKKLYANAVDVPGPVTDRLCDAAKRAGVNVVAGINLRESCGPHHGCLFNAQLFISNKGEILGVRRKLTPINNERAIWGVGDGSDLQVHEMSVGRVGALVCGEHTMSTFRYALAAMGEQIHISNWPGLLKQGRNWDWQGFGESVIRSHAMMSQVFVVNSCSIIGPELFAAFEREGVANTDENRAVLQHFVGFSSIISPFGTYLAGPEVNNEEKLLVAEINMEDIVEAKFAHNPLGYHDRWDVARVVLNAEQTGPLGNFREWQGTPRTVSPGRAALEQAEQIDVRLDVASAALAQPAAHAAAKKPAAASASA